MEVHHHPEVGKKNFKEYLLEGLMIFLAVTMGFFAEGLRENINTREKEKNYITSFINNLEQDTADLNDKIKDNQRKMVYLDSALSLSSRDLKEQADRQSLYRFFGYISFYSSFSSNDATMMQLKNSGGLQYIRRHHVADSIAAYDQEMRGIYAAEAPYSKAINDAVDGAKEFLVFTTKKDSIHFLNKDRAGEPFPLLTNDPKQKIIFFNKIYLEQGWTNNYVNNLKGRLPSARRLLQLLKKEYDLE